MDTIVAAVEMPLLGMPLGIWGGFVTLILLLLAVDLGLLHGQPHEIDVKESMRLATFFVSLGLLFSVIVWWLYYLKDPTTILDPQIGNGMSATARAWTAAELYVTGLLIEQSLSLDNIFIISIVFAYFGVPRIYQHRVLFWGILGVIVMRGVMIFAGAALLKELHWLLYVFAVFLVVTGIKMLVVSETDPDIGNNPVLRFFRRHLRVTEQMHGEHFFVRAPHPKTGHLVTWVTPLFLCLLVIEFIDLVFAVDSVPAIFAITQEPFIVYTSNIFAILGLRSLYFALAAMVHRFHYLRYALALVLVFIGSKIFLQPLVGKIPSTVSLSVTVALLVGGVVYSLWRTRRDGHAAAVAQAALGNDQSAKVVSAGH
jgi:tellurite resistance protein TerC